MLTDDFLESLAQGRLEQLNNALMHEYQRLYPKRCRVLGEDNLKAFCTYTGQKAYEYGASNYGELKTYSFAAWVLGTGFDDDPLYPEIQSILQSEDDFESKMEELEEIVSSRYYLHTTEQLEAYMQALQKLLTINFAKIKELTSYTQIVALLKVVYPQRMEMLGGETRVKEALKSSCHEKILRYNINHPIGIFVYATLVFFLGHKVDDDPLYAWARLYLNDNEPRMAYKLDRLVKVTEKRIKNAKRQIEQILEKEIV